MQFDSLGGFGVHQCAYTTCHHPLPGQPSQSVCEVAGLRGPQGPSGTSDCCCSCQGNQEWRCDRRWRFLSSLHMTLCWRKEMVKGWKGDLCKMQRPPMTAGGFGGNSNPLQRLHQHPPDWSWTQPAHLGVCTSQELRGGLVKNTEEHYRLRAAAEKCTTRWAFSIRTRGVMWSSSN